jgi:hypothetical protein
MAVRQRRALKTPCIRIDDTRTEPEEPPMSQPTPAKQSTHEEPEVTQEESVPSDGRDTEGERLMKDVANRKLHDEGEAEHKTPEKSGKSGNSEKSGRQPEKQGGKQDPA